MRTRRSLQSILAVLSLVAVFVNSEISATHLPSGAGCSLNFRGKTTGYLKAVWRDFLGAAKRP